MQPLEFIRGLAASPLPWLTAESHGPIVSTRVRVARNLAGYAFPGQASISDRRRARGVMAEAVGSLPGRPAGTCLALSDFNPLQLALLQERVLSTAEHARSGSGAALFLEETSQVVLMINETDHIHAYTIRPGLAVEHGWHELEKFDDALRTALPTAWSRQHGFYCASPLNTGSGLRVTALAHLPGLAMADRLEPISRAAERFGFRITPAFGQFPNPVGSLFHIANRYANISSEADLVVRATSYFSEIARIEQESMQFLLESRPELVYDHVERAWGLLGAARLLDSSETINYLMAVRLGISLGMFSRLSHSVIDDLLIGLRPAHLQFRAGRPLNKFERDIRRARVVRQILPRQAAD